MEYSELYPLEKLGGISCKGITLTRRDGNPVPRVAETPSGILNAVGLQNPGVDVFINEDLPWLKKQNTVIIANIAGNTPEDYCAMAEKLSETDVDMIELNISCPNVKSGMVWQVANAVKIPIIGMGGISSWQDAIEMMMAGATALQIGTVLFTDPYAPIKIADGMNEWLDKNGIKSVSEITGTVKPW